MDQQASASNAEWELCNDDGFIYKRMKCVGEKTAAGESTNPAEEERNRRKRKKKILAKLKRKYQREIDHWEILSNNLCALQEKSNQFQSSLPETSSSVETREHIGEDASNFIDELISMEEAREGIIQNVSNVCEIAEEMCRTEEEEEEEKEMFFDLPVWGSPKDLMASLCDDV